MDAQAAAVQYQPMFSGAEALFPEKPIKVNYLGDVQRLVMKPGDTVVVTCDETISDEVVKRIHDHVKAVVGPDHKVLVLSGGLKIGVVGDN